MRNKKLDIGGGMVSISRWSEKYFCTRISYDFLNMWIFLFDSGLNSIFGNALFCGSVIYRITIGLCISIEIIYLKL